MSRELFDAVWRNSPMRGADLIVLICLADATKDAEGPRITMGIPHMAKRCRLSPRSVQVALQRLTKAGAVTVYAMRGTGGRNEFQVIAPTADHRPVAARTITEAQRQRCRNGGAARWGMHSDASPVHSDASPSLPFVHRDASPPCIPMHGVDASGCTTPMHPDAETHASGCTQDGEWTVTRSVTAKPLGGESPPMGQEGSPQPPAGALEEGTPPSPRGGGKTRKRQPGPTLREMMASKISLEGAQATKPAADVRLNPRFHHPGD